MRTVAWYLGSHLNSEPEHAWQLLCVRFFSLSLGAGQEGFLKSRGWVGSTVFHPSWDGLRPPRTWGVSSPSGNGALPTDSTSSVACGVSTVRWERWPHTILGLRNSWLISHVIDSIFLSVEVWIFPLLPEHINRGDWAKRLPSTQNCGISYTVTYCLSLLETGVPCHGHPISSLELPCSLFIKERRHPT